MKLHFAKNWIRKFTEKELEDEPGVIGPMCSKLDYSRVKQELEDFNPSVGIIRMEGPPIKHTGFYEDLRGGAWEVCCIAGTQVYARPKNDEAIQPFRWYTVEIEDE